MVRSATVTYTPSKCDVTDTIRVLYKNNELTSKDVFIAPLFTIDWFKPKTDYIVGSSAEVGFKFKVNGVSQATITDVKCEDNIGQLGASWASLTFPSSGLTESVGVIPIESQVESGLQWIVTFTYKDYIYEFRSEVYTVQPEKVELYDLNISEGNLMYNSEGHVILSGEDSRIDSGETINFKSSEGLSADGKWEDS